MLNIDSIAHLFGSKTNEMNKRKKNEKKMN